MDMNNSIIDERLRTALTQSQVRDRVIETVNECKQFRLSIPDGCKSIHLYLASLSISSPNITQTTFNSDSIPIVGFYQLEPVPLFLKAHDLIPVEAVKAAVLLATDKTLTDNMRAFGSSAKNEEDGVTAFSYFSSFLTKDIDETGEWLFDKQNVWAVRLEEDKPQSAIENTVLMIRSLLESDPEMTVTIHLDRHGGLRGVEMILETIVSLLEGNDHRLSVKYYDVIYSKDNNNKVFQSDTTSKMHMLSAGIREFKASGRTDSLQLFADRMDQSDNNDQDFIKIMTEIAAGLQWCDIVSFTNGIKKLKKFKSKKELSNPYLRICKQSIDAEYEPLLKNVNDYVEYVRWCMNKGFYQQALTLFESKLPKMLWKKGIVRFVPFDSNQENKNDEFYQLCFNGFVYHNATQGNAECWLPWFLLNDLLTPDSLAKWIADTESSLPRPLPVEFSLSLQNKVDKALESDVRELKTNGQYKVEEWTDSSIITDVIQPGANVPPEKLGLFIRLIVLHQRIKNSRNLANHASEEKQVNPEAVLRAMKYYIELVEMLSTDPNSTSKEG